MRQIYYLFESLRPKQWIKNLIVFAGIIFAKELFLVPLLLKSVFAFLLFCIVSSCIYLLNDLKDYESDKVHSRKKQRPIASGKLKPVVVLSFLFVILPISIALSFLLSPLFGMIVSFYLLLMVLYNIWLKSIEVVDAFVIAIGFVLRGIAGVQVIGVKMSPWFFVCALLLALFIVFCKRRHEMLSLKDIAFLHRKSLSRYSLKYLDQLIAILAASVIISYSLYTLAQETVIKFQTRELVYTIPFVLFGLFRFIYLVYEKEEGGSAETMMLTDKPLIFSMIGWLILILLILYHGRINIW